MDVMEKAKELGQLIAESNEMKRLSSSEALFKSDENAIKLLNEYMSIQQEIVMAAQQEKDSKLIESINEKLEAKKDELFSYEVSKNYLEAKSDFDRMMKSINDVIIFSITGEEPCSHDNCSCCDHGCK